MPLLAVLLFGPTALAVQPAGGARAEFSNDMGGRLAGEIVGQCRSIGILPPRGLASFVARELKAEEYRTSWNESVVRPHQPDPSMVWLTRPEQRMTASSLPGGAYRIDHSGGRFEIFPSSWPGRVIGRELNDFTVQWNATVLDSGPSVRGVHDGQYYFQPPGDSHAVYYVGGTPEVSRLIAARGNLSVENEEVVMFLQNATITGPAGTWTTGPAKTRQPVGADNDVARVDHVTVTHWILRLRGFSATFKDVPSACQGANWTIDGEVLARRAFGHAESGSTRRTVNGQALALQGRIHLLERVEGDGLGFVNASAVGAFTFGVDFGVPQGSIGTASVAVISGFLAVLLLAAALAKYWLPLFSRLARPSVLQHQTRGALVDALRANPWSTTSRLMEIVGLDRSTFRHHMRLLLRHGLVQTQRMGVERRFALIGESDCSALSNNPHDAILECLRAKGRMDQRLWELVKQLSDDQGWSRLRAWRKVRRLIQTGHLRDEKRGKETWVRINC